MTMRRMPARLAPLVPAFALVAGLAGCAGRGAQPADEHAGMDHGTASAAGGSTAAQGAVQVATRGLPPGNAEAPARIGASPRHGEWAMIAANGVGGADSVRAWVVYPERRDKAPVVLVIHEIFGLTPWIRSVADQLAADGFIAVAPDLLSGKRPAGYLDDKPDTARAIISTLRPADVQAHLDLVARWGMALPAAQQRYGIVGFCWGGSAVWNHAVHAGARLGAGVVYYGTSPTADVIAASVKTPILGLYGSNDARVNATIPRADSAMRQVGRPFPHQVYEGAGHGFLRQQDGQDGANLAATRDAWPRTIAFLRERLR
jgi:carboxymethylenebutenolidase